MMKKDSTETVVAVPKNWDAVRKEILEKKITVKAACEKLGISRSMYYKLVNSLQEQSVKENEEDLSPDVYFQRLKDSVKVLDDAELNASFKTAANMMQGFKTTGQEKSIKKLTLFMKTMVEERKLIDLGIDTFVYRSDVERFISKVEAKVIKVIELKNYERPIPEEIQQVIAVTDGIFSERYIVFTDYTGKVEKEVEKERRAKDPILFGIFRDENNHPLSDRMYYLGDWVDDKCDLTLDSMISEMKDMTGEDIVHDVVTLTSVKDFQAVLNTVVLKEEDLEDEENDPLEDSPRIKKGDTRKFRIRNQGEPAPKKLFRKVKSILSKKK